MLVKSLNLFLFVLSFKYCTANVGCPDPPTTCKRCIESCPEGQVLVTSPCGCCDNQCADKVECPDPPIQCFVCHWSCPKNQTLKLSPCGCCHNTCVPNEPECSPDFCQRVRCFIPTCQDGYILAAGQSVCGCCPGCVKPAAGDKCYLDYDTQKLTCGKGLKCCRGRCILQTALCPYCPL